MAIIQQGKNCIKTSPLILDIGCGDRKIEGAIDIRRTKDANIIADARYLPFKNEVFDHVYSSHLIEFQPP